MPTYEYQCEACGHHFEKFQSIKAEPIKVCPQCAKKKVRRLIGTGAGIIFKGSGFYCTDYRSPTYNTAAKNDAAGKSDSGSKSGGESSKSQSKPAAATPAPVPSTAKTSSESAK